MSGVLSLTCLMCQFIEHIQVKLAMFFAQNYQVLIFQSIMQKAEEFFGQVDILEHVAEFLCCQKCCLVTDDKDWDFKANESLNRSVRPSIPNK